MYRLLILLLLCALTSSCYEIRRDCSHFKTGNFEFTYTLDGKEKTGHFTRTLNYNIDYYENTVDSATVRWINDCEFILEKLNPQTKSEAKAIHMKILTTTDSTYTFEYKFAVKDPNKPQKVYKGEAKKIE
ncbi:MAG TPA: hypothetical protein VFF15_00200 [Flavobacteriaceae bacterium]|nr:hypothetical protein [Flavobacteriaceae bacterium]